MTATIAQLFRYPLKSAGGERLSRVDVNSAGIVGDRSWAVVVDGQVAKASTRPELAGWASRLAGDALEVDAGEGFGPGDDVVGGQIPGAKLARAEAGHRMVAAVHLITVDAALAPDAPQGCDPHPRANIVIDGIAAGAERAWLGMNVRLGGVVLRVTELPRHCLGVYAEVVYGGVLEERLPVLPESQS